MNRRTQKTKEHVSKLTIFWRSRTSLILLIVIFILVCISVLKEAVLRIERQQEIVQLENEIARLHERNTRMSDVITILNSSSKQDKLARSKLGVHSPDEQVVFFPGDQVAPEKVFETPEAEVVAPVTPEESNPEKWVNYFMGKYNE